MYLPRWVPARLATQPPAAGVPSISPVVQTATETAASSIVKPSGRMAKHGEELETEKCEEGAVAQGVDVEPGRCRLARGLRLGRVAPKEEREKRCRGQAGRALDPEDQSVVAHHEPAADGRSQGYGEVDRHAVQRHHPVEPPRRREGGQGRKVGRMERLR
jgi:hypothetical protein